MSEIGEVIAEKDSSNDAENFDAKPNPHEESTILHAQFFRIGSVNIIGKGLFKISLLMPACIPHWVGLFFIKLIVSRMLYLCS